MSTQKSVQDIEQQIQSEWAKFQNSPWTGSIPKDVITNFKKAVLELAPMKHQIHVKVIREILAKEKSSDKLTYIELGLVINCLLNAPLYLLSDDIDTALTKLDRLEKLRNEYNTSAKERETQLLQKKTTLLQLAGAGGNNGRMIQMPN